MAAGVATGAVRTGATGAGAGGVATTGAGPTGRGGPVRTAAVDVWLGELGTAGEERGAGAGGTTPLVAGSPEEERGARGAVGAGVRGVTRPMAGVGVPGTARWRDGVSVGGAGAVLGKGAAWGGLGAAGGGAAPRGVRSRTGGALAGQPGSVGNGLLRDGCHSGGSPGVRGAEGGKAL